MEATMTSQKEFKFSKEYSTTTREFDDLFKELFNRSWLVNGKEFNLAQLGWKRGYNKRKRALGLCTYSRVGKSRRNVEISMELLTHNLDKAHDFEDTIRHEIAHAIDVEVRGASSHDRQWQYICRAVGADDSRLHEGFLVKPKGKYTLICGSCGYTDEKYRKPKNRKACGKCCNEHNHGRFSTEFELSVRQNY